jgi:hypothetical protein
LEQALLRVSADPEPLGVRCLFKSFETAYAVIRIARPLIEEVSPKHMLVAVQHFYSELNELARAGPIDLSRKQVVVLEGLEGAGKSSIAAGLASAYDVSVVSAPPPSVTAMQGIVADLPKLVSRAVDLIACYFVARDAARASSVVVIVETGFHKCCAEAVCWGSSDLCGGEDAARGRCVDPSVASALDQEVYRWPSDLPQPSLVSFAVVLLFFNSLTVFVCTGYISSTKN